MNGVDDMVACHECDLLHRVRDVPGGGVARCTRCGAALYRQVPHSIERTLSLTVAALVLLLISNAFPFLTFRLEGREQSSTLIGGVIELHNQGFGILAVVVFCMSILFPFVRLVGMLYVLAPLSMGYTPPKLAAVFRWLETLLPWGMVEVYMLGVIVAYVKLADLATIVLGIALYSFGALIVLTTWSSLTLDPRVVWRHVPVSRQATA